MKLYQILKEHLDLSKLYHGTKRADVPSILAHGLDPARSSYAEDEEMNDYEGFGAPYHFIYLSDLPTIAKSFSPGGENNLISDPDQAALLEISLPPDLQQQLIIDRGEFIRAPFVIPPQYIKLIR